MMNYDLTPGIQGICPEGWHVPTAAELCTLASYLDSTFNCNSYGWRGTNAGGKLKNTGFLNWNSPNTGATNESGFSGLGAGGRSYFGSFNNILSSGYFWSSTEYDSLYSIYIRLTNQQARVYYHYYQKTFGFSVRCLRDHWSELSIRHLSIAPAPYHHLPSSRGKICKILIKICNK